MAIPASPAAKSSSTRMVARLRVAAALSRARIPPRAAAYAARYLVKNVVAAGLADHCTIQLSYAIGVAKPLSIYADLHGTGQVDAAKLEKVLMDAMDLSPRGIRNHLDLNKPIYARTAAYGHFGRKAEADGRTSPETLIRQIRSRSISRSHTAVPKASNQKLTLNIIRA
jgi:hypothetical protein